MNYADWLHSSRSFQNEQTSSPLRVEHDSRCSPLLPTARKGKGDEKARKAEGEACCKERLTILMYIIPKGKLITKEERVRESVIHGFLAIWKFEHEHAKKTPEERRAIIQALALVALREIADRQNVDITERIIPMYPQELEAFKDLGMGREEAIQ